MTGGAGMEVVSLRMKLRVMRQKRMGVLRASGGKIDLSTSDMRQTLLVQKLLKGHGVRFKPVITEIDVVAYGLTPKEETFR